MNPEEATSAETSPGDQVLVTVGDPALSLSAKKLADSVHCLNCGTALKGPFCYFCGQPDRNFMRFFPVLLRDLMEDLFDLDSRFMRTMKPLLFKPGRLTRDYMQGRRFRYAPPMRLYIFSSIVFFLLAALLSNDSISMLKNKGENNTAQVVETPVKTQEIIEAPDDLLPDVLEKSDSDTVIVISNDQDTDEPLFKLDDISFNDEPWDRETNPVDIKGLPDWLNDRINDEIEGSPQKAKLINENPNLIIDKAFDILPATMFVLLPVVALIFKFWYLFAKRYYIEHLIFSLHNHAFLFVGLTLILLVNVGETIFQTNNYSTAVTATEWAIMLISIWIPLYLLISLRVVYKQNWLMTMGKFIMISISYLTLLGIVTTGVAIASFVML
ncbi:MAG: DUF3667 domain-containing protein [Xanthomonadales bacterium]|nr:DUF3667 domain-containing protein [Xanthomonadales bacterium]